MNDLVSYLLPSAIILAVMYGLYWLFMSNDCAHKTGRSYLLLSVLLSLIVPLLKIKIKVSPTANYLFILEEIIIKPDQIAETIAGSIKWYQIVVPIYLSVSVFFLFRFFFQIGSLWLMIYKSETIKKEGLNVVLTNRKNIAFSFFNYVFIGFETTRQNQIDKIIAHERVHARQYHSVDLIMLELLTIIHWFNPFVWMIKRSFRNLHEYLADEGVLTTGVNKTEYQNMLIYQTFGTNYNFLTNSFNHSLIKRRFIMMSKGQSNRNNIFKMIFILSVSIIFSMFFSVTLPERLIAQEPEKSVPAKKENTNIEKTAQKEDVFVVVEKMPAYPGGDEARIKFLKENMKYPQEARQKGISGRVFVTFVVEKDGSTTNVKILRGIGGGCDEEAIRVVSLMPAWNPGLEKGKPVRVQFNLPIMFSLEKNKKVEDSQQALPENK